MVYSTLIPPSVTVGLQYFSYIIKDSYGPIVTRPWTCSEDLVVGNP